MASILAGRDGQEKWRACVEFAGVTDHLHFLLKAVVRGGIICGVFGAKIVDTEVPAR